MSWLARIGTVAKANFPLNLPTVAYLFGGRATSTIIADNDSYDRSSWTAETDVTSAEEGMLATVISNVVYACFGRNGASYNLSCYSWDGSSWGSETAATTPNRYAPGGGTIGTTAYFCGGYNPTDTITNSNRSFDTSSWSAETNVPNPKRYAVCSGVLSSKLYLAGGGGLSGSIADCDSWDGASWSAETSITTATAAPGGFTLGANIFITGGYTNTRVGTVESFDGSSWSSEASLSPVRRRAGSAVIENTYGYSMAGDGTASDLTDNDEFDGSSWTAVTDVPTPAREAPAGSQL